jgi:ribokinase
MSSPKPLERPAVLVVGSINEDVILRVPRTPKPGETLAALEVTRRPGGKGANQAVAAARSGAFTTMIARVGDDGAGARMLESLRSEGVGTDLVQVIAGVGTGAAYITVTPDAENTIVLDRGANARLSEADLVTQRDAFEATVVLLAQLEVPIDAVIKAVQLAVECGVRPVLTLSPPQPVPLTVLSSLDPLLVNEHEAAFLLGQTPGRLDPFRAATALRALGPRSVVITIGPRGAVFADDRVARHLPASPVDEIIDTTGAGDAFAGALAASLADGRELAAAVEAGLLAAGTAIGRLGAR